MIYLLIRKQIYDYNYNLLNFKVGALSNFFLSPYTFIKSIIYIELASIITLLSVKLKISANSVSITYCTCGLVAPLIYFYGGIYNRFAVIFYFFIIKGVLDWSDGAIARYTCTTSKLGYILDVWGAQINSNGFLLVLVCHQIINSNNFEVFLCLLILFLNTLDVRNLGLDLNSHNSKLSTTWNESYTKNFVNIIKNGLNFFVDNRARSLDIYLLIIFLDLYFGSLNYSIFIVYIILLASFFRFAGINFYTLRGIK